MIAIATIREKLATIARRFTASCRGALHRASARRAGAARPRNSPNTIVAMRGISASVPTSIRAMAT